MNLPRHLRTPTPAEALAKVAAKRRALLQRKLDRIAELIDEAAFILRIDYPHGALFIEGEGSVNALSDASDEVPCRENAIVVSARFHKGSAGVGGW